MGTTPAIFDSSTVNTTKTLGIVMNSSEDKESFQKLGIENRQWVDCINAESLELIFYGMKGEWDCVVFANIFDLDEKQIKLILEMLRVNPYKSLCFLNAGSWMQNGLIIDSNNVDEISDLVRLKMRKGHELALAIYADTEQDKDNATHRLGEGGYELDDFKIVKIFGALSEENPYSTIDDAINFVCEKPNRVLAMSDLSEFNRSPIEIQRVLKRIDDAESSVSIRFFSRNIVEWLWDAENVSDSGRPFSFYGGNNLSRLIRGLDPVVHYYSTNPYGGSNNGSTKLKSRKYRLIQIYKEEGVSQEDIARRLGVSRATIGRHISKMREVGLVD